MVSSRSVVKGSMVTFDIFVKTLTGKTLTIGYHITACHPAVNCGGVELVRCALT